MRRASCLAALLAISALASLALPLLGDAKVVSANGAPVKIILTYLPALSNTGPTDATGVAEVVLREGEVNLSIAGLPTLTNEVYTGWLLGAENRSAISFGTFNTDNSGVAKLAAILPSDTPTSGWSLVLVTVESAGKVAQIPGERRSIGGYFPQATETKSAPVQLPKTGGDTLGAGRYTNAPNSISLASVPPSKPDGGADALTYGAVILATLCLGIFAKVKLHRK